MIQRLAVLVQCRLVTDGRTDRHTTTAHIALAWRRAVKTVQDRDIVTIER